MDNDLQAGDGPSVEDIIAASEALPPVEAMEAAVRDLWSQVVRRDEDAVVFYDHDGQPARIRHVEDGYTIAWVGENRDGDPVWVQSSRSFDNVREAAFHAFQGQRRAGDM